MKRYSFEELVKMPESKLNELAEADKIDDDDWMYWHEIHDEMEDLAADFIKHELKFYL